MVSAFLPSSDFQQQGVNPSELTKAEVMPSPGADRQRARKSRGSVWTVCPRKQTYLGGLGGGDGHLQEKGTEYLRKSETAKTRRLPGALPKSMLWILKPSIRIKEADGPPLLRPRVRNVPKYKGKRKEENQREREEARKIAPGGLIFDEEDFQRGETYHEGTWGTSFTLLP